MAPVIAGYEPGNTLQVAPLQEALYPSIVDAVKALIKF